MPSTCRRRSCRSAQGRSSCRSRRRLLRRTTTSPMPRRSSARSKKNRAPNTPSTGHLPTATTGMRAGRQASPNSVGPGTPRSGTRGPCPSPAPQTSAPVSAAIVLLRIYTGTRLDTLTPVGSHEYPCEATLSAIAGTTYWIAIDGKLEARARRTLPWGPSRSSRPCSCPCVCGRPDHRSNRSRSSITSVRARRSPETREAGQAQRDIRLSLDRAWVDLSLQARPEIARFLWLTPDLSRARSWAAYLSRSWRSMPLKGERAHYRAFRVSPSRFVVASSAATVPRCVCCDVSAAQVAAAVQAACLAVAGRWSCSWRSPTPTCCSAPRGSRLGTSRMFRMPRWRSCRGRWSSRTAR